MSQYLRAWRSSRYRFGWFGINTYRHHLSPILAKRFSAWFSKILFSTLTSLNGLGESRPTKQDQAGQSRRFIVRQITVNLKSKSILMSNQVELTFMQVHRR